MKVIQNHKVGLLLTLSSCLVIFIRLHEFGINFDSSLYATISRNFTENPDFWNLGFSPYLFPNFSVHPPMAFWLQGFIFKLLGASDATARLLNSCSGVLIILLIYYLGKMMVHQCFGLIAATVALLTYQFLYATSTFLLDVTCTLWSMLAIVGAFRFVQDRGIPWVNIALTSLCCSCALLTKGIFALVPIGTLGMFVLVGVNSRRQKLWILAALIASFILPILYFWLQSAYGRYPYLWEHIQNEFLSNAQRNPAGQMQFGLIKTYFLGYAPWSFLFPFSLLTVGRYCHKYNMHRFLYLFTAINFVFFSFSYKTLGHYLTLFVPISSLVVASLFLYVNEKLRLPTTLTLAKIVLGLSICIAFIAHVIPHRIRLSSEPDYFVVAKMVRNLSAVQITNIYALGKGFDPWVLTERGQWYWDLPINYQTNFDLYLQMSETERLQTALLVKTSHLIETQAMFPFAFSNLSMYFQTALFSFFIPGELAKLKPFLEHAPLDIPISIH